MGFNSAFKGLNSALDEGEWSNSPRGHFTPAKEFRYSLTKGVRRPEWLGEEKISRPFCDSNLGPSSP